LALTALTIIERNRLFQGLPPATLLQLAQLAVRRPCAEGAIVFSQGDPGDSLYGVVTGKIRISASSRSGKEVFLNIMEPGDSFGEIALLDGQPRTATACAMAPSELVIIRREHFLAMLEREPKLVNHLLQLLCQRVRWTSGLAEDSALLDVPARLARRLIILGKFHGRATAAGIRLAISQEELARFLGLSRQIVNQHLQHWKTEGWVDLGRGSIVVRNEPALQSVAAGTPERLAQPGRPVRS
jgi:CRP-like cAMP-binding protein